MQYMRIHGWRYFKPLMLRLFLYKNIYKTSINKYKQIHRYRTSCPAHLSNLNYFVLLPPLMMQDSWSFDIALIQAKIPSPYPNFRSTCNKTQWLTEWNDFAMSGVTGRPSSVSLSVISKYLKSLFHFCLYVYFDICCLTWSKKRSNAFF